MTDPANHSNFFSLCVRNSAVRRATTDGMKHYIKATALCLHLVLIVGLCACEEQDGSASGAVSSEVMDGWINNAWTGFGAFCAGDEELAMVSEIAGAK